MWKKVGNIKGEKGSDGLSAYAIWLAAGNKGGVEDFLESIKGKDGKSIKGDKGDSIKGDNGLSAYQIWLLRGNEGTEEDFLNSLKGKDGKDATLSQFIYPNNKGLPVGGTEGQIVVKKGGSNYISEWKNVTDAITNLTVSNFASPNVSQWTNDAGYLTAATAPLTNSHILVGNSSNIATDVAMSGDATINNAGAVTVAHAPASGITGTTLASNVVTSSLTSVGTLAGLNVATTIYVASNTLGPGAIELGNSVGLATNPVLIFHSGSTPTNYDFRMVASGGDGTDGNGTLTLTGSTLALGSTNLTGATANITAITGTLQTAAQTKITSLGTLTGLTVSGGITNLTGNGTTALLVNSGAIGLGLTTNAATGIEHGYTGGSATTPYYDWHSSGNNIDYDFRMVASGGTGVAGNGTLTLTGATLALGNTNLTSSGNIGGTWNGNAIGVTKGGTGLTSTTANQLLYSSASNTIAGLATANNAVLITSSGGVPSISSTLPSAVQDNITRLGSVTSCTQLSVQSGSIDTTGSVIQCAASNAGSNQRILVSNTETANTSSHAKLQTNTNNSGSGDPLVEYSITSQTTFTSGLDNSDSDSFKEQFSATIGSSSTRVVTTAGEQTMPLQPAFLAYLATTVSNVTGNGASFTLGNTTALTEVYDQNGDFNPTGGTFTSPVTAKLPFSGVIIVAGCTVASYADLRLVTSNRTYVFQQIQRPGSADNLGPSGSVLADMDAGDTANLEILVTGEAANTADVQGSSLLLSYFSGGILC